MTARDIIVSVATMAQEKQNANPTVYNVKSKPKRSASLGDIVDEEKEEPIDDQEVFDLIRCVLSFAPAVSSPSAA